MDPMQFILNKLLSDPRLANNPQAQEWLNVIKNNDSAKGEQIAQNILNSYGMTNEEGVKAAMEAFGLK